MADIKDNLTTFSIPLTGRWRNDVDPINFDPGDFSSLINMRYTARGIKGVSGMTKITAAACAYLNVINGYHFRRDFTSESHIFTQITSATRSRLLKSDNTAAPPLPDTFSTFLQLDSDAAPNTDTARFSDCPDDSMAVCNGHANYIWGGDYYRCARFYSYDPSDETKWFDYTDKINNNLTDAANLATLYRVSSDAYILIGSTRAIQSVTFTISTANTSACVATGWNFTSSGWTSITLTDGTSSGGKSLAQSGTISFASTVDTSVASIVHENMAYWYKFKFTGISSGVTISHVSLNAPIQAITDIWCGITISPYAFLRYVTKYLDMLLNISQDYYVSSDEYTYGWLGNLTAGGYLYVGFDTRATAIKFLMPDASRVNTTSACTMTVYYYNGSGWTAVSNLSDGTSDGGISLGHSGTVSWTPPSEQLEFRYSINGSVDLYFYRLTWDKNISGSADTDVRVHTVSGIPAQTTLHAHKFPLFWQRRLWLCNDTNQYPNSMICSAQETAQAFNGADSKRFFIGNGDELVAAATLFTRYGGNLYDNAVILKRNATNLIDGTAPSNYRDYTISDSIGCVAPLTLQRCEVSYEVVPGITKQVLIWVSSRGVELFDGNTIINISSDISAFFDPLSSYYISSTYISSASAFYDELTSEYHLLITTGTSTHIELVYDLINKKWYELSRGAKYLLSGFSVRAPSGIRYVYGGTADGYIERLENGTTFDGVSMAYSFITGDSILTKSPMYVSQVRNIKFMGITRATTAQLVTIAHYADSKLASTSVGTFTQLHSGYRTFSSKPSCPVDAVSHAFSVSTTTTDESVGLEPIFLGGFYKAIREDT